MNWNDKIAETRKGLRNLNGVIPDTANAFGALGKAVKEGGMLDFKTKELIALGISICIRCEPCISLHIAALIRAGVTREEIGDVAAMGIQMGGGPAMMYAAKAMECYDELAAS